MLRNIFSAFLRQRQAGSTVNYASVNTDMHSHFIPGIDDGCKTLDESVALIRQMIELGFRKLITTPHIMSDSYRNTPEIIFSGLDQLRKRLVQEYIHIEIEAAAEYYLDDFFLQLLKQGNLLSFGTEKYLLVETSYINYPENINQVAFDILSKGFTPVLAHPERYPYWAMRFDEYAKLKEMGFLFQLNINSLGGYYSPEVKKTAEKLVERNLVDFIGSDLHHDRHMAGLRHALKSKHLDVLMTGELLNKKL
jgi:tyrosine-protein phosphatase YwqE